MHEQETEFEKQNEYIFICTSPYFFPIFEVSLHDSKRESAWKIRI
ncbi:hypothetical protein HMPREF1981_01181 [Bacteroides pyogenes F0041]|uniref:Uncharacterized protein n=1 Tax=Bacteroides pyogenes F0041 TaxID=1321819 RepID=U2CPI1_9BACE|nr:hypothetical protein HMPREF1981_01181 [Bacteroides pyogenes F0041]